LELRCDQLMVLLKQVCVASGMTKAVKAGLVAGGNQGRAHIFVFLRVTIGAG
jgi:hypothetical protein